MFKSSLAFAASRLFFAKKHPENVPPGSMGWPLIGETLMFLKPHKSNSIGTFLQDHFTRYGKVFKSHLFGSPTIVSADCDLNSFVLQNEEKLFKCSYPKAVHEILGKSSMLLVEGDVHKRLRNVAICFTNICKSSPKYFYDIDKLLTLDLMVKQILDLEPEHPSASRILEDFLTFMKGFISLPIYLPGTSYTKAVKARERICSTVKSILEERKVGLRDEKIDYLDVILSNESLIDEERVSTVLDLLLAGYDTTSVLIQMVVYFLGQSPKVLEHLKEEHQEIRKRKDTGPLNLEDYKQMEFTQNVIQEALRCGNIVKFVHRRALKDVYYKGYFIPSGWKVLPIATAVHLDPSNYTDPLKFNPWRWTGQEKEKTFAPFGGGLRLCPGADLGKIETAFFLHHLLLNFRFQTYEEDHPLAYPFVDFKRGLPIKIEPIETI
ncbi:hypothetical protein Scep_021143 [Stephania cephalantha]|uniref:Cytochrome P450 n=1 Tax=Stephania cephalantha TaxID=152367 RepID=A0AAP0F3U2_9MAGN